MDIFSSFYFICASSDVDLGWLTALHASQSHQQETCIEILSAYEEKEK